MNNFLVGKWQPWGVNYMTRATKERCRWGHCLKYYLCKGYLNDGDIAVAILSKECDTCTDTVGKWTIYDDEPKYKEAMKILEGIEK